MIDFVFDLFNTLTDIFYNSSSLNIPVNNQIVTKHISKIKKIPIPPRIKPMLDMNYFKYIKGKTNTDIVLSNSIDDGYLGPICHLGDTYLEVLFYILPYFLLFSLLSGIIFTYFYYFYYNRVSKLKTCKDSNICKYYKHGMKNTHNNMLIRRSQRLINKNTNKPHLDFVPNR